MPVREKGRKSPVRSLHVLSHVPSHAQNAAKVRGFSPSDSGFTAETDWLLEERGFEPLVPRTDGVAFPNTFCRPELHRLKADRFRPEGSGRRVEFHFPPPRLCCEPGREPASNPKFCG
jgi:hypothetical protein